MQAQGKSRSIHLRWATIALSLFILLSCTALCTHIDKNGGDDGKGHCSLCLSAAAHGVQPIAVVQVRPESITAEFAPQPGPLVEHSRFVSSLYIRPPPHS